MVFAVTSSLPLEVATLNPDKDQVYLSDPWWVETLCRDLGEVTQGMSRLESVVPETLHMVSSFLFGQTGLFKTSIVINISFKNDIWH